jgi:hypothetical protein
MNTNLSIKFKKGTIADEDLDKIRDGKEEKLRKFTKYQLCKVKRIHGCA